MLKKSLNGGSKTKKAKSIENRKEKLRKLEYQNRKSNF